MRQKEFLQCGCEKCFFCIEGLTNGIAHKKAKQTITTFVQPDNTPTMPKNCTDKRVNLQRDSQYCRQCYRNLCNGDDDDTALLYDQKKKCATVCVVDARLVMNPFAKNAGKLGTICTIEIVHNTPSF